MSWLVNRWFDNNNGRMKTAATNPLHAEIAGQAADLEAIAERIGTQIDSLPEVFAGLDSEKPRIRYGCLKVLQIIGEKQPGVLYPSFDRLVDLLNSEKTIIKWGAIIIIGNLAAVDSDNKIESVLDRYLRPISGPVMITAANIIRGAGKIALAKPHLADKIVRSLLQVESANYQTLECRNVALGHAVLSLDLFFDRIGDPRPVIDFIERQRHNARNAVQRKAVAFLKRHRHYLPR